MTMNYILKHFKQNLIISIKVIETKNKMHFFYLQHPDIIIIAYLYII